MLEGDCAHDRMMAASNAQNSAVKCSDPPDADFVPSERPVSLDDAQFVHNLIHDLGAPVRAIVHGTEWLAEGLEEQEIPAESLELMELIRNRATRLQRMIEGLRSFYEAGSSHSKLEPLRLDEVCEQIAEPWLEASHMQFEVYGDAASQTFDLPASALRSVLSELIKNAFVHHDRPDGRVTVAICGPERGFLRVQISDDGPGIGPGERARAFELFRGSRSDDPHSIGLGLALALRTVVTHRANLSMRFGDHTEFQRGTEVLVLWPCERGTVQ